MRRQKNGEFLYILNGRLLDDLFKGRDHTVEDTLLVCQVVIMWLCDTQTRAGKCPAEGNKTHSFECVGDVDDAERGVILEDELVMKNDDNMTRVSV